MMFENQFNPWERLLHRFAFRSGFSQVMLADLEDRMFASDLTGVVADRPVYISGLPRSGTTILLQLLNNTRRFATHTYEDMPFLLCPLLWSRFAGRFTVERPLRERAHGDGLEISTRTPEAFEEMVWKRFWPGHYKDDRIEPWTSTDRNAEFDEFFERHMAKIIAVRERGRLGSTRLRYLSKNNVNIARVEGLPAPLRHGILLVPFRDPFQHAASMHLQHSRFSTLHERDGFARRYMEGIGHYDFGLTLRPINFDEWIDNPGSPEDLEFWLQYWNAAYRHILNHPGPSIHLVSYSRLTSEPHVVLQRLAEVAEVPLELLLARVDDLKAPRIHEVEREAVSSQTREEACRVFADLQEVYRSQA